MRRAAIAIALIVVVVDNSVGHAEPSQLTGTELYDWCTSQIEEIRNGCRAYLAGFVEGFTTGQQLTHYRKFVCLPNGVSPSQLQLIVQKAMREHPELLKQGANVITTQALTGAFGCKPGQIPEYGARSN